MRRVTKAELRRHADSRSIPDRTGRPGLGAGVVAAVLLGNIAAGYVVVRFAVPIAHSRYLPWIVGRSLGMAAFGALFLLVVLGVWMRHPWRARWGGLHAETMLRVHAALGASVVVLLAGHVTALALDRYAGVGWAGALVPDAATYRPVAVTLGVLAAYGVLAIVGTVTLAGRVVRRGWRPLHHLSLPVFALVWCHGLLAGSDGPRLRLLYGATGALVCLLAATRYLAAAGRSTRLIDPTAGRALGQRRP